jgi:hypothetical protein
MKSEPVKTIPMNKWDIARRDVLKSLGIGAAMLPILRASAVHAQSKPYQTLMIFHNSEGYTLGKWRPPVGPLASATFPELTKPLEPFRNEISFVTNMDQPNYPVGYNWAHECYGVIYWGGPSSPPSGKYHEPHGATLDQAVAGALGTQMRKSLNLDAQVNNKPASGTAGAFRCFWTGRGAPINPLSNPTTVYGDLFANRPAPGPTMPGMSQPAGPDPQVVKTVATQKSILDYVGKSLERFKTKVGRDERGAIDGHFTAIRTLETELGGLGGGGGAGGPITPGGGFNPPKPEAFENAAIASQPGLFPKIMHAQADIALLALTSGVTRVATLQLSNSAGNYFNFGLYVQGVPLQNSTGYKSNVVNFHDAAHNPVQGGVRIKELVDKWFMDQFAIFLGKAKSVTQPGGTFLDNSLVMWGNHMGDGGAHSAYQQAWIFAGSAGKTIRTGQHIDGGSPLRGGGGKSTNNCMADICKAMGVTNAPAHWTGTVGLAV